MTKQQKEILEYKREIKKLKRDNFLLKEKVKKLERENLLELANQRTDYRGAIDRIVELEKENLKLDDKLDKAAPVRKQKY